MLNTSWHVPYCSSLSSCEATLGSPHPKDWNPSAWLKKHNRRSEQPVSDLLLIMCYLSVGLTHSHLGVECDKEIRQAGIFAPELYTIMMQEPATRTTVGYDTAHLGDGVGSRAGYAEFNKHYWTMYMKAAPKPLPDGQCSLAHNGSLLHSSVPFFSSFSSKWSRYRWPCSQRLASPDNPPPEVSWLAQPLCVTLNTTIDIRTTAAAISYNN